MTWDEKAMESLSVSEVMLIFILNFVFIPFITIMHCLCKDMPVLALDILCDNDCIIKRNTVD